jgi:hypothetical protein
MANERRTEAMTEEELAKAYGEPLPDREAMSVIRGADPLPLPIVPVEPDPTIVQLDDPNTR